MGIGSREQNSFEKCTDQAEVFGEKGINMWIRSQGENIKILHR